MTTIMDMRIITEARQAPVMQGQRHMSRTLRRAYITAFSKAA